MESKKTFKSVGWSFTSFSELPPVIKDTKKVRCMIYQREIAPSTGKLHWQGAFRVWNRNGITFQSAQKQAPQGAHLEPSKGDWGANVAYCSKIDSRADPDIEATMLGDSPAFGKAWADKKIDNLKVLGEMAIQGCDIKEIVQADIPTFMRNHNAVRFLLECFKKRDCPVIRPLASFNIPPIVDLHLYAYILEGSTKIGKTSYAFAHFKNPLFVSDIDDLKLLSKEHDAIIFDDMEFSHWPVTSQIHLVDMEYTRSVRCRNINATIPALLPRIFTCNPGRFPFSYDPAIERRIVRIQLGNEKLYKE